MIEKHYYVRFSDDPKSYKFSYEDYKGIFMIASSYGAVLSRVCHRYGVTIYLAVASNFPPICKFLAL